MEQQLKAPSSLKFKLFLEKVKEILNNLKRIFFGNRQSIVGSIIILIFIFIGIFGPIIWPYNGNVENVAATQLLAPSWEHPFGTDIWGRDVFRQIVNGAGEVLAIAFVTGFISTAIAVVMGMFSGLMGGIVDKIIQFITNVFLTIPSLPVFLILAAIFTIDDVFTFSLVLSIFNWAGLSRAIRAQIISLKERDFIQVCKVMKMSKAHIVFKELLPNVSSYILINFIIIMKNAITGSVSLMVLGVAALNPTNWGAILTTAKNSGALVNPNAYIWIFSPIASIALIQFGAVMLARGLDDTLNPRLRVM